MGFRFFGFHPMNYWMRLDLECSRRIALQLGLKVHGTLGILSRAKREGRIVSLRQALDLLRERGTWINQELYDEVLRIVGE